MSSHLSEQQIEQYRGRAMPPEELLTVDDHLAVCDDCRRKLGEEKKASVAFANLRAELNTIAGSEPQHVFYEQLEAYVDEKLGEVDREIVEAHLEMCPQCKVESDDLRAFKDEMASFKKSAAPRPSMWGKFLDYLRLPNFISLQAASMAAATLLAVFSFWLGAQLFGLRSEVGRLRQTNDELQKQVSAVPSLEQELAGVRREAESLRTNNDNLQKRLMEQLEQSNSSAQNLIAFYDGDRFVTLDKQGNLAGFESLPSNYQQTIKTALQTERIAAPSLGLDGKVDRLMGGSPEGARVLALGPSGKVIQTDRPTFRWRPVEQATAYTVSVFDSKFNEVTPGQQVSEAEFTWPRPLERGRIYYWQVTALKGSERIASSTAGFKVLDEAKVAELEKAKSTGSHLVLGLLYAQAGLTDEAEKEFQSLLEKNPKSGTLKRLLGGVRKIKKY